MIFPTLLLFFKAVFFGFMVAAPVGPVGAMVIKRTLHRGRIMGFFTGAGSALGDTLYATIVGLGISAVQSFVQHNEKPISLVGGIVLFVVGSLAIRKNFEERKNSPAHGGIQAADKELDVEMGAKVRKLDKEFETMALRSSFARRAFKATLGSFLITISNPVTIVGFAGTFAAFGFWSSGAPQSMVDVKYLAVVGGICLGALSWWLLLAHIVHTLGNRLSNTWIFRIHVSTSLVIIASAFVCLGRSLSL